MRSLRSLYNIQHFDMTFNDILGCIAVFAIEFNVTILQHNYHTFVIDIEFNVCYYIAKSREHTDALVEAVQARSSLDRIKPLSEHLTLKTS